MLLAGEEYEVVGIGNHDHLGMGLLPKASDLCFDHVSLSRSNRHSEGQSSLEQIPEALKSDPDELASSTYLRLSKQLLKRVFDGAF